MTRHILATLLLVALTSTARSQDDPAPLQVGDGVMRKQVITRVAPVYSPIARQARIQGTVILKVRINKSGDVESMQLVSGHPMLAPAAVDAVKQWKYKPYLLNDEPVVVETDVTVNFTLADKPVSDKPVENKAVEDKPAEGTVGDAPGGIPEGEQGGLAPSAEGPPTQPQIAVLQRVRVSQGVAQRLVVSKIPPQYPPEARNQRIQGVVVMQVIIDKEGNVADIQLISGHPLLAPSAIEAVKQWKYKPYLLNQAPVEVETQVTVNFTLAG